MRTSVLGTVAVLLYGVSITSCQNKYEEQLNGTYVLDSARPDSIVQEGSVELTLQPDGAYGLIAHGTLTQGTWEAGDNGDWTWIDFHGVQDAQARVVGEKSETIELLIPATFCCPEMTALRLKRKSTTRVP